MKKFINKTFPNERDLYNEDSVELVNCVFAGEEDGESALKESSNVCLTDCFMDLRYPLWHVNHLKMKGCKMTENCRAALWYSQDAYIKNCNLGGIKALRECKNIVVEDSEINSAEFGWRSKDLSFTNCKINGEYVFFECENLKLDNVKFGGKYSFQYCKNLTLKNCILNTKDAFWHAENVTVENCEITGEYIAWYSNNLTFINCKIIGTQPFCYANGLTLIDCEMIGADLAFEYTSANASLKGSLISVKNFKSGEITVDKVGEIIKGNSVYPIEGKIIERNKK